MTDAVATARDRKPRILCVDDEEQVLEGLKDTLRRSFDVRVATSGQEGLAQLRSEPDGFAIVMSDMRMPVMQGSVFLREARRIAPDAARILLTGYADLESAVRAVNDGQLFRFLTKPCARDELMRACAAGVGHHRVLSAERLVLEQTLRGSVQALADVLALSSPVAFGRSSRVKGVVARFADALGLDDRWEVEVAAMLAPIGAVTLPTAVAEKLYAARPTTPDEQAMIDRLPQVTRGILGQIPRLDGVVRILEAVDGPWRVGDGDARAPIGARMLRIVFDHDALETQGMAQDVALGTLRGRTDVYDPELLDAFAGTIGGTEPLVVSEIPLVELVPGMVLLDDVRAVGSDVLLIAHGQSATPELVMRLRNFPPGFVGEPLRVGAPADPSS
jgi:response regulator RpfG family c-di-GMP phosphodiesterase